MARIKVGILEIKQQRDRAWRKAKEEREDMGWMPTPDERLWFRYGFDAAAKWLLKQDEEQATPDEE